MTASRRALSLAATTLALAAAGAACAGPLPHFRAVDLFDLHPDARTQTLVDVVPNASGQVAGTVSRGRADARDTAFVTGPRGAGRATLSDASGRQVIPMAINDAGRVVGMTQDAQHASRAFLVADDGHSVVDLGTLGGEDGAAEAINTAGVFVGTASESGGRARAFIASIDDPVLRDLGVPGFNANARAVNDAGQVAGSFNDEIGGDFHAYLTEPGGANPRVLTPDRPSDATGVNVQGQVVGSAFSDGGVRIAFMTGPNGAPVQLFRQGRADDPAAWSTLTSIDDAGHAVGVVNHGDNAGDAVWADVERGVLVKLDSLTTLPAGVHLNYARIDRLGRIYADGTGHHVYLLLAE